MSHDFERELRRRFAEAGQLPSDEGFVARVSERVRRQRRRQTTARFGMAGALALGVGIAAPAAFSAFDYVARLPELVAAPMAAFLVTPAGWAFSALFASVAVLGATGGAHTLRRRSR